MLNNDAVRAELGWIDPELVKCFNRTKIKYLPGVMYITAYHLLAKKHKALREIIPRAVMASKMTLKDDLDGVRANLLGIEKIARNAVKGEK